MSVWKAVPKQRGWVGAGRRTAGLAQAPASVQTQAQVWAGNKLLIKQDYAKLCGVFSMWTKIPLGIKLRPPNSFYPDPGVRLERHSPEAASADCSLSSSLSLSYGLYLKAVESTGFYDTGRWVYSFMFTVWEEDNKINPNALISHTNSYTLFLLLSTGISQSSWTETKYTLLHAKSSLILNYLPHILSKSQKNPRCILEC